MLNKDEELRVASFIDCLREDVNKERENADLAPKALLWLALKTKELNDKFKEYDNSIKELIDKEWASHWERNKEEDEKE